MFTARGCRSILLTSLIAIAPACDGEKEPQGKDATAKDAKAKDEGEDTKACDDARAKAIEKEMLAGCGFSDTVLELDVPEAPWKAAPSAPPSKAVSLKMTTAGTVVEWGQPVPAEQLGQRLNEAMEREAEVAKITGGQPQGWSLAIEGDVSRADVTGVLDAIAKSGHPKGHLVLTTKDVGDPPRPRKPEILAAVHAKVATLDPSQRATMLAKEIEQTMPKCPGVVKAFSAVAMAAPEQKCQLLARGISEGLVACGCPDADELLTLLYGITVDTEIPTQRAVTLPVTIDPSATSRAGSTWAEVIAGLDEGALGGLWVATR